MLVLDPTWTPAIGDPPEAVAARHLPSSLVERLDLFDRALERVDAWGDRDRHRRHVHGRGHDVLVPTARDDVALGPRAASGARAIADLERDLRSSTPGRSPPTSRPWPTSSAARGPRAHLPGPPPRSLRRRRPRPRRRSLTRNRRSRASDACSDGAGPSPPNVTVHPPRLQARQGPWGLAGMESPRSASAAKRILAERVAWIARRRAGARYRPDEPGHPPARRHGRRRSAASTRSSDP